MSTYELLDELEAGELSIQYEGEEPQALLEWAIARVQPAPRDLGRVPGRRRRADRHGVQDRSERPHLHGRHRPPAARDARADRRAARRSTTGLNLHVLEPDAGPGRAAWSRRRAST